MKISIKRRDDFYAYMQIPFQDPYEDGSYTHSCLDTYDVYYVYYGIYYLIDSQDLMIKYSRQKQ